jgi:ribosome modulation factor
MRRRKEERKERGYAKEFRWGYGEGASALMCPERMGTEGGKS